MLKAHLRASLAALLLATGALAGCSSDRPGATEPQTPSGDLVSSTIEMADSLAAGLLEPVEATALTRKLQLPQDQWASAFVSPTRGGVLQLQPAGLTVVIPPGAVSRSMVIWAKARRGSLVAYEFGPHGTQFLVPITMTQDLKPTSWYSGLDPSAVSVGYFKDGAQVDDAAGRARIDEFLPIKVLTSGNKVQFEVRHFSGYLLSTGRSNR